MSLPLNSLCWLRRDLRLADHPALTAAVKDGKMAAVYIFDDTDPHAPGGASRWWLYHSLVSLKENLAAHHIPLILRRGDPIKIIPALIKEMGAENLHASERYDPHGRAQDATLAKKMSFTLHEGTLLHDPAQVKTKTGGFYKVYTPFSRVVMALDIPEPLHAPKQKTMPRLDVKSDDLDDWHLLPTKPDWAGIIRQWWRPGEKTAVKLLSDMNRGKITNYAHGRDRPALNATSHLSPHLAWGEISPRQIWHAVHHHAEAGGTGMDHNRLTFMKELVWRDFAAHTLYHQPELPSAPLDKRFTKFPWLRSEKNMKAWQRGETGYPIVDAGMRQLWQTGWMHNRVRMIVASFLIKHLMLKWQAGEDWFWDTLVDAELGNNSFNWQWVAGSGADASPYFRIFNPTLQGEKFDPDGEYIRRFVPELRDLPRKYIHRPWDAPDDMMEKATVLLGDNYPHPIVDHDTARARALDAFKKLRNS